MAIFDLGDLDNPQSAQSVNVGQFGPSHDSLQDWRSVFTAAEEVRKIAADLDGTDEEIKDLIDQAEDIVVDANNAVTIANQIAEDTITTVSDRFAKIEQMHAEVEEDRTEVEINKDTAVSSASKASQEATQAETFADEAEQSLIRVEAIDANIKGVKATASFTDAAQPSASFNTNTSTIEIKIPSTIAVDPSAVTSIVDTAGVKHAGDVSVTAAMVGAFAIDGSSKIEVPMEFKVNDDHEFQISAAVASKRSGKAQFKLLHNSTPRKGLVIDSDGNSAFGGRLFVNNLDGTPDEVYSTANKPTPADVDAMPRNEAYTKSEADNKYRTKADSYNRSEIDNKVNAKVTNNPNNGLLYARRNTNWEEVKSEAVPIGTIVDHYSTATPDGWLACTKGAVLDGVLYKDLFNFLKGQREAPVYTGFGTTEYNDNMGWSNGITASSKQVGQWHENKPGITVGDNRVVIGGNVNNISGMYLWKKGSPAVLRVEITVASDVSTFVFSVIKGTMDEALRDYAYPNKYDVYRRLTDIPLSSTTMFLPDVSGNFVRGYDPSSGRKVGSFEQDAIRNITGGFDPSAYVSGNYSQPPTGVFKLKAPSDGSTGFFDNSSDHWDTAAVRAVGFDASTVVPTGPENTPKNVTVLKIIKAYDSIKDPTQILADDIKDKIVNLEMERVPTGTVIPFYGTLPPSGYLSMDGSKIFETEYPTLCNHLISMRKPVLKVGTFTYTSSDGDTSNWEEGFTENWNSTGQRAITFCAGPGQARVDHRPFYGLFITLRNSRTTIARLKAYPGSYLQETWNRAFVEMVSGTWEDFKANGQGNVYEVYSSLTDIPLNNAVFLPDMRGQYISGYDPRTGRFIGTGEGDAIRNITGEFNLIGSSAIPVSNYTGNPVHAGAFAADGANSAPFLGEHTSSKAPNRAASKFDASRVVPTDSTNHPQNVNFLWCIKAYDSIKDPEQLAAKEVVDDLNFMKAYLVDLDLGTF